MPKATHVPRESSDDIDPEKDIRALLAIHPRLKRNNLKYYREGKTALQRLGKLQEDAIRLGRGDPVAEVARIRDVLRKCEKSEGGR